MDASGIAIIAVAGSLRKMSLAAVQQLLPRLSWIWFEGLRTTLDAYGNDEPQGAESNAGIPALGSEAHNKLPGTASGLEKSNSKFVSLVIKTDCMMRR